MDSIDDELPPDLARLRNQIACGLYDQLSIRNDAIEQEDVAGVAYALTMRLARNYRFEAMPEEEAAEDDSMSLDAATFRGSALGSARYPIFDWDGR